MSTTSEDVELHPCKCGDPDCTEMVKGRYARGHWAKSQARKRNLAPLPGPDDEPDEDLPPELVAELDGLGDDDLAWLDDQPPARPGVPAEQADDPPAARIPPSRTTAGAGSRTRRTAGPSATVRKDVQAKIRMVLLPAGQMWAVRDQMCGPVFVEQEPLISEALAEIVCDSPDLLNWFTGPAGGYMKYFKLLMAVQPVALVVWMHHVAHAQPRMPHGDGQQPQYQRFAA